MNDQPTNLKSILAHSEVDSVFASARRAIDHQRRRILDTELDYATRRHELLAQLTDLDAEYQRRMPELHDQLQRLEAMRS